MGARRPVVAAKGPTAPHSHWASVTWIGRRSFSRVNTLNAPGSNSQLDGTAKQDGAGVESGADEPGPRQTDGVRKRKMRSTATRAAVRQRENRTCGGRAPSRRSLH